MRRRCNMKKYLATKEQLDAQNQTLAQITTKIASKDLTSVTAAILDFNNDDIIITSGGLDSIRRRITT